MEQTVMIHPLEMQRLFLQWRKQRVYKKKPLSLSRTTPSTYIARACSPRRTGDTSALYLSYEMKNIYGEREPEYQYYFANDTIYANRIALVDTRLQTHGDFYSTRKTGCTVFYMYRCLRYSGDIFRAKAVAIGKENETMFRHILPMFERITTLYKDWLILTDISWLSSLYNKRNIEYYVPDVSYCEPKSNISKTKETHYDYYVNVFIRSLQKMQILSSSWLSFVLLRHVPSARLPRVKRTCILSWCSSSWASWMAFSSRSQETHAFALFN